MAGDHTLPVLTNCILWDNVPESTYGPISHSIVGQNPRFTESGFFAFYRFVTFGIAGTTYEFPEFILEEPDFTLREDSPAVDPGTLDGAPGTDATGNGRPCGAGIDLGAYERGTCLPGRFRRGDANLDEHVNISDAVFVLTYIFRQGDASRCPDAADVNDDGTVNLADAVVLLAHLFTDVSPLPQALAATMGTCAFDATPDELPACRYDPCRDELP